MGATGLGSMTGSTGTGAAGAEAQAEKGGYGSQPAVETATTGAGKRQTTIRLPLITATITRNAPRVAETGQGQGHGSAAAPAPPSQPALAGVPASRLLFYTGAAALAALEVVEWPVTLLVVAGAYLADRARGPQPAPPLTATPLIVPSPAAVHSAGAPDST